VKSLVAAIFASSLGCASHHETTAPAAHVTVQPVAATSATVAASASPTYGVRGPPDPPTNAVQEAAQYGVIGLLSADGSAPTAPWGSDSLGTPPQRTQLQQGTTTVNGRLPPEVIQRIVRQNFGRFKLCYENGLRTTPGLTGLISVRFVIDTQGSVSSASREASTTMPDTSVVECVVRGFGNLTFPQPEGGEVTVVYPIRFAPGD
jgi:hypothetical protein